MITMSLAPATLPVGQRVYVIGDVHGCADRLEKVHSLIRDDLSARPVAEPTVVHLGDYVDRGPDSAGVVARLARGWSTGPAPRVINLMGNHEDMMLAALDRADGDSVAQWLANGGANALASWGVSPRTPAAGWRERFPADHLALVRRLGLFHRQGGYVFVHAGLRPGVPIEKQTREDMLWIREPFLSSTAAFPGVVVHGHTPERSVVVRPHRIGVDTGAVMGGVLTCAVLEGDRVGFLRA
jgi:serine/threonine protein phosphatase 1